MTADSPSPAGQVALLTNPTAGRGRGARAREVALGRLREAGVEVRDLVGRDAAEALDLAHAAVADGVDALVVVGGDGMVHLAAQAAAQSGTALGLVPCGTGNDVARYLALPRRDPAAAVDRILAGRVRTIDLARGAGRYYVTVLAAGFDALVSERANRLTWPRGQLRYHLATLAELRVFRPLSYTLDVVTDAGAEQLRLDAMLVAVGNGASFGGGLRITEGAELDDGLLDVVVIGPMSRAALVRTYPMLMRGTHVDHPLYSRHRVRSVTLASPGITAYADGERFGALPLTVECVPGALRIHV